MLRVGGAETYDAWTRGRIGFTSQTMMKAGKLANTVVFKAGYVRGGATSISHETWSTQLHSALAPDSVTGETKPECWMHHQADFMLTMVPAADQIGTGVDFFVLPPTDQSKPTPIIGTASFVSALADRPEVREFIQYIVKREWGSEFWAAEPGNDVVSANQRFDFSNYGDASRDPAVGVRKRLAEATMSALQSDAFRMDASDLTPEVIGRAP